LAECLLETDDDIAIRVSS